MYTSAETTGTGGFPSQDVSCLLLMTRNVKMETCLLAAGCMGSCKPFSSQPPPDATVLADTQQAKPLVYCIPS